MTEFMLALKTNRKIDAIKLLRAFVGPDPEAISDSPHCGGLKECKDFVDHVASRIVPDSHLQQTAKAVAELRRVYGDDYARNMLRNITDF